MARWLEGGAVLYLQQFVSSEKTISTNLHAYSEMVMHEMAELANRYLPTYVRGIE